MDKIQSANQLNSFLAGVIKHAGLKLKYRITVDPPLPEDRDWERPEILVEFAGPDASLLLERGAELLRSLEAFLDQNGQWKKTARQLYCHRHTLRYRIRRVEQLTGRDLSTARDRIEFWLALRARELVQ